MYKIFTSESVAAGHPDKICDAISDAIVDAVLEQDPKAKVAVETAVKDRIVFLGEINTTAEVDFTKIARAEVKRLGYTNPDWGFHDKSPVEVRVNLQSPEIAQGVEEDEGAGDQGMMFGYAVNETKQLMPMPITLAHHLVQALDIARETKKLAYLRPDGKAQVTVRYEDNKPVGIDKVVMAIPHDENIKLKTVANEVYEAIIVPVLAGHGMKVDRGSVTINGTGRWHTPGPFSDAGVTGRKIIVDGYGGMARVGGGAFSGKDPSKVDRSGAYGARYVAKNIVAAGLADRVEVALAYCIGVPLPVMRAVETFGTEKVSEKEIAAFIDKTLDTSVRGIIDGLDLRRPIYKPTSAYGHFGRDEFPWERITG